jgi:DNA primase
MIPKETVAKILETAEIVDVVSDFISLKKRGANYLGLCPFHNEKGPSFTVSPAKGIYKCFGCGKSGAPVNFIMEHEGLTYPEALRFLAKKYSIKIEEVEQTADQIKEQNAKESMMLLSTYAQQQFTKNLWEDEEGKRIGLSYFKERGFSKQTIERFQLGYSLENRKAFSDKALADGYLMEYLVKTGLTIENEGRYFDRFSGRVIFPIHNISGRAIAFGGRILTNDKKLAKYLNSPESEIYHKSNVLYGLFQAKKTIVEKNNCYLVEGYTDVVSLSQAGVENVVASAGTSLTVEQIRLIRRFTPNVTIMYDGDSAGIKASFRGINLILTEGLNVKVLLFPDGEDPDSFAKKHTQEDLLAFMEGNTTDFISFKTKLLLDETKNDPIGKAQLIHDIVESISLIPDGIARSLYIKECSRLMTVDEQLLINELNKSLRKQRSKTGNEAGTSEEYHPEIITLPTEQPESIVQNAELDVSAQEDEVIRLLLLHGEKMVTYEFNDEEGVKSKFEIHVSSLIFKLLEHEDITFENYINQNIFTFISENLKQSILTNIQNFIASEDEKIRSTVIAIVDDKNYLIDPNWKTKYKVNPVEKDSNLVLLIERAIIRLKQKHLLKLIHKVEEDLKLAVTEEEYTNLLTEKIVLQEIRKSVFDETGIIITH